MTLDQLYCKLKSLTDDFLSDDRQVVVSINGVWLSIGDIVIEKNIRFGADNIVIKLGKNTAAKNNSSAERSSEAGG